MKLIQELDRIIQLKEMPRLIAPLESHDFFTENSEIFDVFDDQIDCDEVRPLGKFNNLPFYLLGDSYILMNYPTEEVAAVVRFYDAKDSAIGAFATSTFVAQYPKENSPGKGFAFKIFFDYLLKKFPTMATDSLQTADGRRFWESRIKESFSRNLNVYLFDFKTKDILQVEDFDDFQKQSIKFKLYGGSKTNENRAALISRVNLII